MSAPNISSHAEVLGSRVRISDTHHGPTQLPSFVHGLLLAGSVVAAYLWLQVPLLNYYSLQAFAVCVLLYFVLKRLGKAKIWHIIPAQTSLEMIVVTFAFLLLIGSTGNFHSPFYSLTYIHLFLLVFTSGYKTSTSITALLMLFHYGLSAGDPRLNIGALAGLPVVLFFFLFAKSQYEEVLRERRIIAADEMTLNELEKTAGELESFMADFTRNKLGQVRALTQQPLENKQAILGQIGLLEIEIDRKLSQIRWRKQK